jgi:hypothetical protein
MGSKTQTFFLDLRTTPIRRNARIRLALIWQPMSCHEFTFRSALNEYINSVLSETKFY